MGVSSRFDHHIAMPQYILHKRISVLNRFQKKVRIFDTNYIGKFKHHHGGFFGRKKFPRSCSKSRPPV